MEHPEPPPITALTTYHLFKTLENKPMMHIFLKLIYPKAVWDLLNHLNNKSVVYQESPFSAEEFNTYFVNMPVSLTKDLTPKHVTSSKTFNISDEFAFT